MAHMSTKTKISGFEDGFNSKHLDSLDGEIEDFPWDELYESLGEKITERDLEEFANALEKVFDWVAEPLMGGHTKKSLHQIGLRTVAALWCVNPKRFAGMSGRQLSATFGMNPFAISQHATKFSARFKMVNRSQGNGRNGKHAKKLSTDKPAVELPEQPNPENN